MGRIVFVLGGTRSGKSSFALREASRIEGRKLFVATAQAYDEEMEQRIGKHRSERGDDWETLEEPIQLARAVGQVCLTYDVALIDCLTIWLSNLMCAEGDIEKAQNDFIESLKGVPDSLGLFIVSNEVGMGIVPENAMARQFRDLAGRLNQRVAEVASRVFFVAAGIPMKIK